MTPVQLYSLGLELRKYGPIPYRLLLLIRDKCPFKQRGGFKYELYYYQNGLNAHRVLRGQLEGIGWTSEKIDALPYLGNR